MRREIKKRIAAMEGTLKPMSDVDALVKRIADRIEREGGVPGIIRALRALDRETPLDLDGSPSLWYKRRIEELRSKGNLTLNEKEELQGYIKTRRRQDEELQALQHLQNTDKTGLGGGLDSLGKKFSGGR